MKTKNIIIKYEDLHPELKKTIDEVKNAREKREKAFGLIANPITTTGLVILSTALIDSSSILPITGASVAAAGTLGGYTAYKIKSEKVRKATEKTSETIQKLQFLDKNNKIELKKHADSHPIAIIDRKGNLHLIANTRFQQAIAKAQKTFLKHVIPARYRINIK